MKSLASRIMDKIIELIVSALFGGGPPELLVIAGLLIAVGALLKERRRLQVEIKKKDDKIDKIIDDYYQGNKTLSETLCGLKSALHEIKGKIQ